jgi:hypothetical protein
MNETKQREDSRNWQQTAKGRILQSDGPQVKHMLLELEFFGAKTQAKENWWNLGLIVKLVSLSHQRKTLFFQDS